MRQDQVAGCGAARARGHAPQGVDKRPTNWPTYRSRSSLRRCRCAVWRGGCMAGGEQRGWRAGHRGEAQDRSRRARHRSEVQQQEQYLVEGVARQETCKSQTEGKPDLEYRRFGEYIMQLEERWAKLEDRLTAHVEAEIESWAAQWRDYVVERQKVLDDDRASMVEQAIEAGFRDPC